MTTTTTTTEYSFAVLAKTFGYCKKILKHVKYTMKYKDKLKKKKESSSKKNCFIDLH
jgi:hypothetical protein